MSRSALLAATLAAGLVLIAGCDLEIDSTPDTAPTTRTPTSGGVPTSVSSSVPSTRLGGVFPSPKAAADALLAAWHIGDKNAALKAAGPNTVDKVFAGVVNNDARVQGCNPGSAAGVNHAFDCYYRYEGGSTHFHVDPYPATGWRVVDFTQITD